MSTNLARIGEKARKEPDLMYTSLFIRRIRKQCRGEAYYFRFANDFLACFQYKVDAQNFMNQLRQRLKDFSLELGEDKTWCIKFGRFARDEARRQGHKPDEFTFLGFTHYCVKNQGGVL